MSLIIKFLKIFVFLSFMKGLRHSGCWGGKGTLIYLLHFFDIEILKGFEKRQILSIFKNNENRGGIIIQQ